MTIHSEVSDLCRQKHSNTTQVSYPRAELSLELDLPGLLLPLVLTAHEMMAIGTAPPRKSLRRVASPATYAPAKRALKYSTDGERTQALKNSKQRWYARRKKTIRVWDQGRRQSKKVCDTDTLDCTVDIETMNTAIWSTPVRCLQPTLQSPLPPSSPDSSLASRPSRVTHPARRSPLPPSSPEPINPTVISFGGAGSEGGDDEGSQQQHFPSAIQAKTWEDCLPATMVVITCTSRVEALRTDLLGHLLPDPPTWEQHFRLSQHIKDNVQGSERRAELVMVAIGHVLTACERAGLIILSISADYPTQDALPDLVEWIEEVEFAYEGLCEYARLGSASPSVRHPVATHKQTKHTTPQTRPVASCGCYHNPVLDLAMQLANSMGDQDAEPPGLDAATARQQDLLASQLPFQVRGLMRSVATCLWSELLQDPTLADHAADAFETPRQRPQVHDPQSSQNSIPLDHSLDSVMDNWSSPIDRSSSIPVDHSLDSPMAKWTTPQVVKEPVAASATADDDQFPLAKRARSMSSQRSDIKTDLSNGDGVRRGLETIDEERSELSTEPEVSISERRFTIEVQNLMGPRAYAAYQDLLTCQDCRQAMPTRELPLHSLFCYQDTLKHAEKLASEDNRAEDHAQRVRVRCRACKKWVRTILWENHHASRCRAGLSIDEVIRMSRQIGYSSEEDSDGEPVHDAGPPSFGRSWPNIDDVRAYEASLGQPGVAVDDENCVVNTTDNLAQETQQQRRNAKARIDATADGSENDTGSDQDLPVHARAGWESDDYEKFYGQYADSGDEDDTTPLKSQAGPSTAPQANFHSSKPRLEQEFRGWLDWFNYDLTMQTAFGNKGRPSKLKVKLTRQTISLFKKMLSLFTAGTGMPWEGFLLLLGYQSRLAASGEKELFKNFLRNDADYPLRRALDDLIGPGGHSTLKATAEKFDKFVKEYPDEDQRNEILLRNAIDHPLGKHGVEESTHEFRRHFLYLRRLFSTLAAKFHFDGFFILAGTNPWYEIAPEVLRRPMPKIGRSTSSPGITTSWRLRLQNIAREDFRTNLASVQCNVLSDIRCIEEGRKPPQRKYAASEPPDRLAVARHAVGIKGMPDSDISSLLQPLNVKSFAPGGLETAGRAQRDVINPKCLSNATNRPTSEPDPPSALVTDDENFKMIKIPYQTLDAARPEWGILKLRIPTAHWHTTIDTDLIVAKSEVVTTDMAKKFNAMLDEYKLSGPSVSVRSGWQYHKMIKYIKRTHRTLLWAVPPPYPLPGDDERNPPGSKSRKKSQLQRLSDHGKAYVYTHWMKTDMPKLVDPIKIPDDQLVRLPGRHDSPTIAMLSTQVLFPDHLKGTPEYNLFHGTYRASLDNGDTIGISEAMMQSRMDFPRRTSDFVFDENPASKPRKARSRSGPSLAERQQNPRITQSPAQAQMMEMTRMRGMKVMFLLFRHGRLAPSLLLLDGIRKLTIAVAGIVDAGDGDDDSDYDPKKIRQAPQVEVVHSHYEEVDTDEDSDPAYASAVDDEPVKSGVLRPEPPPITALAQQRSTADAVTTEHVAESSTKAGRATPMISQVGATGPNPHTPVTHLNSLLATSNPLAVTQPHQTFGFEAPRFEQQAFGLTVQPQHSASQLQQETFSFTAPQIRQAQPAQQATTAIVTTLSKRKASKESSGPFVHASSSHQAKQVRAPTPHADIEIDEHSPLAPIARTRSSKRAHQGSAAAAVEDDRSPKRRRLTKPLVAATPHRQQPSRLARNTEVARAAVTDTSTTTALKLTQTAAATHLPAAAATGQPVLQAAGYEPMIYLHIPGERTNGIGYPIPERLSTGKPTLSAFQAATKLLKRNEPFDNLRAAHYITLKFIKDGWPANAMMTDKIKAVLDALG
ncbi:hypothetical protein BKA62DRAFT_676588 [Auriculariales sp. MPI-PUGE-AT-0066]|nr:hypothetical protein BKA62DRAFT_676588 [Auriculariales sp. MPI-PUGE-AT-0066]